MNFVSYLGGVLAAGGIWLWARRYYHPDKLPPALTWPRVIAISGTLVVSGIGLIGLQTARDHFKAPSDVMGVVVGLLFIVNGAIQAIQFHRRPKKLPPNIVPRRKYLVPSGLIFGGALLILSSFLHFA